MLLTLQSQIANEFKAVHLNINTVLQRVAHLESTTQPKQDGEDVQSPVDTSSHEQSLAPTTDHEQSLATPSGCEQSLATPSGREQSLATSNGELQQQPAVINSAQSHKVSLLGQKPGSSQLRRPSVLVTSGVRFRHGGVD